MSTTPEKTQTLFWRSKFDPEMLCDACATEVVNHAARGFHHFETMTAAAEHYNEELKDHGEPGVPAFTSTSYGMCDRCGANN